MKEIVRKTAQKEVRKFCQEVSIFARPYHAQVYVTNANQSLSASNAKLKILKMDL
jgi:hypothetical protein